MAGNIRETIKQNPGKSLVGGGLAAALVIATPLVSNWEGKRNTPYADLVGVMTVCYGETRVAMRSYSDAECTTMLEDALEDDFAKPVLKCTPGLRDRPYQLAAAISLSYNIGSGAYCRSTAARRFNAGNWRGGCDALLMWNKAGGRVVQGLVNRRKDERRICLTGLS